VKPALSSWGELQDLIDERWDGILDVDLKQQSLGTEAAPVVFLPENPASDTKAR
jgi:hypothetical protein